MDEETLIITFIMSIALTICFAIITYFIVQYFFNSRIKGIEKTSETLTSISEGLMNQSSEITKLMGTNLDTLQKNVTAQLIELRQMQTALQSTQKDTQGSFEKFISLVKMRPQMKGQIGEGIVRWILDSLPAGSWEEQVRVVGGIIDFLIYLPQNDERILIDSKFSFPQELLEEENLVAVDRKTMTLINRRTIQRGKELEKYLVPGNTNVGFLLMYIPDILYTYLSEQTFKELTIKRIIPVNVSGLLSTLFLITRQIQAFHIGQAIERLEVIKTTVDLDYASIERLIDTGKKQLENAVKNMEKIENKLHQSHKNIFKEFGLIETQKE